MNQRRNLLIAALVAGLSLPAFAQVKPNATPAEVAAYSGADRAQKLV
jgi:hypothetical protein